jgi:DNA-binding MarR family transcriptional regulator
MTRQLASQQGRDNNALHLRSEMEELLFALIAQTGIQLQNALDSRFRPLGLTAQEAALVVRCVEARAKSSGELARIMGRDKGGITRHLDKLQARGLIERYSDPRDRRVTLVRATQRGHRLAPRCKETFLAARAQSLEELFDVEMHQLTDALFRISTRLGTSKRKLLECKRSGTSKQVRVRKPFEP